jgi:hypothetical protein
VAALQKKKGRNMREKHPRAIKAEYMHKNKKRSTLTYTIRGMSVGAK